MTTPTAAQDAQTYTGMPYLNDAGVIAYIHVARANAKYPPLLARLPDGRYVLVTISGGRARIMLQGTVPHCPKSFCVFRNAQPVGRSGDVP